MDRLNIWGDVIPGNSPVKKETVMELGSRTLRFFPVDMIRWLLTLKKQTFSPKAKKIIDTYTHTWVRKEDPEYHDTFEDVPYLIPFIAQNSKKAVIIVPGGGYCAKSMEAEGTQIAQRLQRSGITAFVLWYRCNPYYQPYPLMDMQRAVRYVRYHAKDYGYDPNQIGAIGFSAGGAQVALFANVLRGGFLDLPDYLHDEIDDTDDALDFIGLGYPALGYHYNRSMVFASFPAEEAEDPKQCEEIRKTYDALNHMSTQGIPHFITYGTKDTMVSVNEIHSYIDKLKESGTPCTLSVIAGAGHGYGAGNESWMNQFIEWLRN